MKFKVGDKVRVKSKEWYNTNNIDSVVSTEVCTFNFIEEMTPTCATVLTIKSVEQAYYIVDENDYLWHDFMLEDKTITDIPMWPTAEDTQQVKEAADKLLAIQAEEASTLPLYSDTQKNMGYVLDSMKDLLIYKNTKYGNSALEPMDVFTRHLSDGNSAGLNSILVRLDDKLKRIQNAEELRKNDVSDLIGYLTLLCVDQEWIDFSEFKD